MSVAQAHAAPAHDTSTGLSHAKVAVWTFLASECLLFGALISTFLLYRSRSLSGPTPSRHTYDIAYTSVSSFILLMSSLTMVLALAAIQRGDHQKLRVWLMATALLGMCFISGQVYEFTRFVQDGLTIKTNVFGSSFFLLTGFHGLHVTVGILMLLSLYLMSLDGRLPSDRAETVELVGLYWHFVDVVWIVIFTVVYLIPAGEVRAMQAEAESELAHHPGPREYVKVAIVLAVATGAEVGLFYMNLPHALFVLLLLFFAAIKFSLVVLWFMHLRFDSQIFRRLFLLGLSLATAVYLIVLSIFGIFRG